MENLGVIDIGSNGIRMAIGHVDEQGRIRILYKRRESIRLGHDVFASGKISQSNFTRTLFSFRIFRELFRKFQVSRWRAMATSAVREAQNGIEFSHLISQQTGIEIEVIDGQREASLIHRSVLQALNLANHRTVCMDIGGGSLELIISQNRKIIRAESFPLGTVRVLREFQGRSIDRDELAHQVFRFRETISQFLKSEKMAYRLLVGTGGNMECLGKLRKRALYKDTSSYLQASELSVVIDRLFSLGTQGRIEQLGLRSDRADVILPASLMVKMLMIETGIGRIELPRVGLREGILLEFHHGQRIAKKRMTKSKGKAPVRKHSKARGKRAG